jgi:hypothetical protein
MNSKYLFFAPIILLFVSCGSDPVKAEQKTEIEYIENEIPPVDDFNYDTLKGMYMGDFGGSEIRIILNYVSGTNVIGYNIHKGLQRNINGKLRRSGDSIVMSLPEPGDHKFDGVFELTFLGIDKKPRANWTSNSGKIPAKNFNLKKLEAPKDSKEGINISNFAEYFGYVYDTLGSYTFESDGFCLYEYYPKTDETNRVEQLKEVKGTWSLVGNTVTIDWQKNSVFTDPKMIFEITTDEYEEYILKGKDRELYQYYY